MPQTATGQGQTHQHGQGCGHTAIRHAGHVDYLDDGHLQHMSEGRRMEEHRLGVDSTNPNLCTPNHRCDAHETEHTHSPGCGHQAVPHGDHTDYLVAGHLHHPHGDHCDDHGPVATV
jgi:hypothetical protein